MDKYTLYHTMQSKLQRSLGNNGSNWESLSLGCGGLPLPDSKSVTENFSALSFDNRANKLGLSSNEESGVSELSGPAFKLWTCCKQTWTASCTLTKYHSLPINSTRPDFEKVSRTSGLGLDIAICKKNKLKLDSGNSVDPRWWFLSILTVVESSQSYCTWMSRNLYSWYKSFKAWTALESM